MAGTNRVTRTTLCGCKFEYTWTTDVDVDEQVTSVIARCPDHASLSDPQQLHLQIKAEDYAVSATRRALAQRFPQHRRLVDGVPVEDVDDVNLTVTAVGRRVVVTGFAAASPQAQAAIIHPADQVAVVKAKMRTLKDVLL